MYNPLTGKYHISRDIKWLNRIYFKGVRFHNTEDLLRLKAGKSDKQKSDALNDISDNEYIEIDEEVTDDEEGADINGPVNGDKNDNTSQLSNADSDNSNEDNPFKSSNEDRGKVQGTTRSGRVSYAPKYLLYNKEDNEEVSNTAFTKSELKYSIHSRNSMNSMAVIKPLEQDL